MCHHNLEVELGPRINFIVGENGSGKSAVLTAICLTLGANSRKTERSSKGIKGFIREGSNFAKLEVSIRNVGPDALDVGLYGDSITVERTINASGAAPFRIKNQWGKDVGHSRDHLLRITDHFNIDVDNPIVVMSQDASRQFLHSGKDSDKYKFFVKATLLEDIQNKLAYVKGQVQEMDKLIAEKEEELPQVEMEVERLEEEANSFKKMEEYRTNVEQLRNRLAWCEVYEAERISSQLEGEVANYKNNVTPKLEEQLLANQATVASCEKECEEAAARLSAFRGKAAELMDTKRAAEAKFKETDRLARRAETNLMALENVIKDKSQTAAALEESIASARMSVEEQSQAQDASIQRAIVEAEKRRAEARAALDDVNAREADLRRKGDVAQGEESSARAALTSVENAIRDVTQQLNGVQQDDGNQLAKFGRGMPRLAQVLQQHASKFSKPPVGPIGMHVKLKDAQWAMPVEEHFGGFFGGFVVANMKDRATLDKMMRDCGCPPNIHVTNFNRGKYEMPENKLPSAGLVTMMDVLEIDHPAVFNVVVDNTSIERVVLVPDEGQARTIVYGPTRQPNVKEAYTYHRKLWQKGQSQFETQFKSNLAPRLATDKSQLVAKFTRDREDLAREKEEKLARLGEARRGKEALKGAADEVRRLRREALERCDRAEIAVRDARAVAEERVGPAKVDVHALVEELEDLRAQLDGELKEQKETMLAARAAAVKAAKGANDALQACKAAAAAEAADGAAVQERYEAASGILTQSINDLQYYQNKKQELADRIVDSERSSADYKLVLAAKIEEAKRVCARGTAEDYLQPGESEMEVSALQTRYEKAKRMVEKESRRHARPQEEVNRALAETKRKFKRLQMTLKNARDPCNRLKKGVKHRQRLLRETSTAVNKEVSHRFNYYMAKKGHAGKVLVDYKTATLELDVKMHGQGQTVKDTRSMSGGERSYSTLALTLSLGESIESPFRAMDEFDVFMDAVNRKVSMDALIDFARDPFNKDKQFLFITPQDISAVDASAKDIKVQKMKAARPT